MAFPLSFSEAFIKKFGSTVWPELLRREPVYSRFWKIKSSDKNQTDIAYWMGTQTKSIFIKKVCQEQGFMCSGIEKYDDVMRRILVWVKNNIFYVPDISSHKMDEYWQTVDETLSLRKGDCEDGAVLICVLAAVAGVPSHRFKLQFGSVIGGGHCYVVYRGDNDAVEKVLDWCYWFTPWAVGLRAWVGDDNRYGEVWGSVRVEVSSND